MGEMPPVDQLQLFIPEALRAFESITRKPPLPKVVHHYTTAEGLLGILQSETIWATNARFVNDASELTYGREVVCATLAEEIKVQSGPALKWLSKFPDLLHHVFDENETYIACFCEAGNLLSQWRAYGAGKGFSLTFSAPHLSGLNFATISRVEYEPDVQKAAVEETLRIHLREFDLAIAAKNGDRVAEVSGALALMLSLWVVNFKHPSFAEEREWRVSPVATIHAARVRSDSGWLRPYLEIPLTGVGAKPDRMPLIEITCGPSPRPDLTKRALTLLLSGGKYNDIPVRGSDIPLRT